MKQNKHVALVYGGLSAEREVSLVSGREIEKALIEMGYKVTAIDMGRDIAEKLAKAKPDVVFNALHGTYGEDGCLPGLLEIMQIPYTHSGVLASAIAMNKQRAKAVFADLGILTPKGKVMSTDDILAGKIDIPKPYVIKPIAEGSSVGVYIILEGYNYDHPTAQELEKYDEMLVEQYIPGREITAAVTDDYLLSVTEIRPKEGFYDYRNKYTNGMTEHIVPAPVDKKIYDEALAITAKVHKAFGCRGVSRTDFKYNEEGDGKLYLLEVNTHPGMTPLSLVPEMATYLGIGFKGIIEYLVENARCDNFIPSWHKSYKTEENALEKHNA